MKLAQQAFTLPEGAEIANMLIGRLGETTLKPDSPVFCINRGRKPIETMYDANHVKIEPGLFEMEYHAALHIQRREIVPGTRNLEVGGFISWIGILGSTDGRVAVDPPELCQPFTDDELQTFGESIEAIDRKAMAGADAHVTAIRMSNARAGLRHQGVGGMRPVVDASQQGSENAAEAAAHVMDPVPSDQRETSIANNEAVSEAPPAPRPMRRAR